jgi:hypothetical protein
MVPPVWASDGPRTGWATAGSGKADVATKAAPTTAVNTAVKRIQRKTPPPRLVIHPLIGGRATSQGLEEIPDAEMDEIVPGGEHHQCQHQGQADAKAVFLGPLAQRLSAKRFRRIEQ